MNITLLTVFVNTTTNRNVQYIVLWCMSETRISHYQDVLVRVKSKTIPKSHYDIMENRIPQI